MSSRISSVIRTSMAAALLAASAVATQAADIIAPGPYAPVGPESVCAQTNYLGAIQRRFRIQAREVHHDPALSILAISNIRQNRFLPKIDEVRAVDRLYCQGTASMSDGRNRTVWYLVEYGAGFAGAFGDNVEFCVSGLDRWNVYDGYCRVLR